MKILMVTMSMNIGGAETHILELCRELVARGNDVTLASFGGVYADEAVKSGVKHVKLPLNTKNPASVAKAYRGLRALILRERFDLVHAHARIPAFICGLLWDRLSLDGYKFRFVTTAHLDFSVNPLWRKISRWGERVMAVSDDIADYLIREYSYPEERIHRTINGIDTEKFSPSTDYEAILSANGLVKERRRIVYMSRLDADRAAAAFTLLEVAPQLCEKYPDCDIVIVGGGGELERIREEAERVNKIIGRNSVTVTGAVSNTNEYCAAADVFIGVSRSALEAMSAAKAVIVAGNQGALGIFDESKIRDAYLTNFCCRGFPCESADEMFTDVSRLLDMSSEEKEKMGAYNREFIEKNYTVRRMADDYLEMYQMVLASPRPFFGKPDIVISGYYGFGNLGDESLLDVIASSIASEYPGVKISALTKKPHSDSQRTGLKCASRFNMIAVFGMLSGAKLLISGGGSLLQDSTSKRSLRYYAGVIKFAKYLRCRVFIYANGIGPIKYKSNKRLTSMVVSSADAVSVRDEDSRAELISLGVPEEKITLSADPTSIIKPAQREKTEEILRELGVYGKYFVVSVRPISVRAGSAAGAEAENEAIVARIADTCCKINRDHGLTPILVPMQLSADLDICEKISERISGHGIQSAIYKAKSASKLMGILADAQFTLGMRLHIIIFASSVGCPVIGISYDPKVSSMMHRLGQRCCVELKRDSAEDGLMEEILAHAVTVSENRDEIQKELFENADRMSRLCRNDIDEVGKLI